MANTQPVKTVDQRRLETLYSLVGDRAVNADRNMRMMSAINSGIYTALGVLIGGIIGSKHGKTDIGMGLGGVSGFTASLLGDAAGRSMASLSMGKYDRNELRDTYMDPSVLGYVLPGYAEYQQQRIEDLSKAKDLQLEQRQMNARGMRKKSAVFTEKDVKDMIAKAEEEKLRGRHILQRYTPKQIAQLANGIGPNWEPEWFAKTLNFLMPWGKIPAVIHDLEWAEGKGSTQEFHRSNDRFLSNNKKLQGPTSVVNPARLLPLALFYAVESNKPHYAAGRENNPYYEDAYSKKLSESKLEPVTA